MQHSLTMKAAPDVDLQLKKKKGDNKELVERIDIDEFLIKGGECGCFQIFVQSGLFLVLFPLVFPILLFYYIGYDPPWRCLYNNNNITHSVDFNKTCSNSSVIFPHDDGSRCDLDRSEWTFHYHKTTLVTEFDLVCNRSSLNALAGSIVFIGWAIGIVISGYLSDNYGRKWTMFIGFFVTTVLLFVSAFVNQIWQLIAVRFFIGLFFAAPALNTYVMVVEIVGPNRRVMATTMSHFCSVAAGIVLTIKAKFINEWKTLTMACSVPYLIGMVAVFCVPESVRWLNLKGRTKEAEAILRKAAKYNKKILPSVSLEPAESEEKHGRKASYIDLFKRWKLAKSMLAQGFIWFQCGMSTYALTWSFANLSGDMYKNYILSLMMQIFGHLVVWFLLQKVGRKKTCIWFCVGTVVGCFIVACIPKTEKLAVYRLVFGMTGFFMISNVFTVMYMWSSEIYPTVLRTQGMGINIVTSRLGAATSPFIKILDQFHPSAPFILMSLCSMVATALCFMLPETKDRQTRETLRDMLEDAVELRTMAAVDIREDLSDDSEIDYDADIEETHALILTKV